jgi:hypothetical protein
LWKNFQEEIKLRNAEDPDASKSEAPVAPRARLQDKFLSSKGSNKAFGLSKVGKQEVFWLPKERTRFLGDPPTKPEVEQDGRGMLPVSLVLPRKDYADFTTVESTPEDQKSEA